VQFAQVTGKAVASLGYLIVFGSLIAFSAFTWLHKVAPAARISTYAYVNPVVAVILGWALASEPLGSRTVLAAAIIIAGVFLVNRGRFQPARTASERRQASSTEYPASESSAAD
jgi:drug/metabolite transporter (DMT)-like permease